MEVAVVEAMGKVAHPTSPKQKHMMIERRVLIAGESLLKSLHKGTFLTALIRSKNKI